MLAGNDPEARGGGRSAEDNCAGGNRPRVREGYGCSWVRNEGIGPVCDGLYPGAAGDGMASGARSECQGRHFSRLFRRYFDYNGGGCSGRMVYSNTREMVVNVGFQSKRKTRQMCLRNQAKAE